MLQNAKSGGCWTLIWIPLDPDGFPLMAFRANELIGMKSMKKRQVLRNPTHWNRRVFSGWGWTVYQKLIQQLKTISVTKPLARQSLLTTNYELFSTCLSGTFVQDRLLVFLVCAENSGNDDVAKRKHQMNMCDCKYHMYINTFLITSTHIYICILYIVSIIYVTSFVIHY